MNKLLLALGVLAASAFVIPDAADAQRGGGRGGGFRGGGFGGDSRMYIPRGGGGGPRVRMDAGGFRGGAIAARPGAPGRVAGISPRAGGFRQAAINNPGGRFDNRGDWRYGVRPPGSWRARYPYYGGRYPYYGRNYGRYPYYGGSYGGWGLATGAVIGAAATYPYYNDPYSTYQTPVASAVGGYCVTPVRTCALTSSAPVGIGCSCRIPGGRARGTVQ